MSRPERASPEGPDSGPIRVLYVVADGTHPDVEFLERECPGMDVLTETSAEAALERIGREEVDCVVSASEVADLDGVQFLERARKHWPDLPFILCPDDGTEADAEAAVSAGVTDYLGTVSGSGRHRLLATKIRNATDRRRARETVTKVRERLTDLSEQSPDVQWVFTADWEECLFVTSDYETLYGATTETLLEDPRSFLDAVHPEDRQSVTDAMERVSDGDPVSLEYRVTPEPKVERWVWASGKPARDETGRVVRIVGFSRDITDRKRREQRRKRREVVLQALDDPVYALDADGRFTEVNDAFVDLVGYDRETLLGSTPDLIKDDEAVRAAERNLGRLLSSSGPEGVSFEVTIQPADGDPVPCEDNMAVIQSDGGSFEGSVGVLRDVSERKARERALREEKAFVEQSLDALEDVFFVFDPNGGIRRWNGKLNEVTGYTDAGIEEMQPTDFFPDDHVDRIAESVAEVLTEAGTTRVQADYLTKDGERIPHEFVGHRLTDSNGELLGFAGIGRDITERLEHERQLENHNERLEEFASIVSHDLRNPLNLARGRLQLARAERDSEHLAAVEDAHERIERLIEDLLAMTREGDMALELQSLSVGDVARSGWQGIDTPEATLRIEESPTIRADKARLTQLVENLFRNAVEHGGPEVCVTVGSLESPDGFYVADDGPGISPDERTDVFDSGYTTEEEGIGIGLSIVRRIAEAHGWDIAAEESPERGTRFAVTGIDRSEG